MKFSLIRVFFLNYLSDAKMVEEFYIETEGEQKIRYPIGNACSIPTDLWSINLHSQ